MVDWLLILVNGLKAILSISCTAALISLLIYWYCIFASFFPFAFAFLFHLPLLWRSWFETPMQCNFFILSLSNAQVRVIIEAFNMVFHRITYELFLNYQKSCCNLPEIWWEFLTTVLFALHFCSVENYSKCRTLFFESTRENDLYQKM